MKKFDCFAVCCCLLSFFMIGCSESTEKNNSPSETVVSSSGKTAASTESLPDIPDAKVEEIGKKCEEDFKSNPLKVALPFIDGKKIVNLIKEDPNYQKLPKSEKDGLVNVYNGENQRMQMAAQLAPQLKGARLTYSGIHRSYGHVNAVMRLEQSDGGVDYWLLQCAQNGNEVVAEDLYMLISGGTANEFLAKAAADLLQLFSSDPAKGEAAMNARIAIVGKITAALRLKQFDAVIKVYESNQCETYKMFSVDLLYLRAISGKIISNKDPSQINENTEKMEKAVDSVKAYKPDYAGGNLFLIEAYMTAKNNEKAIQVINNLRKAVGDDPHLDFQEANFSVLKGDTEKALTLFKTAGRKGLRSPFYLLAYYLFLKDSPNASEKAAQKIKDTGVELYGPSFVKTLEMAEKIKNK